MSEPSISEALLPSLLYTLDYGVKRLFSFLFGKCLIKGCAYCSADGRIRDE